MTDFFADLEGHLQDAARRRARRRRLPEQRVVFALAAAVVAFALVFTVLGAVDRTSDPEVASPPPTSSCGGAPDATIARYAVFRREATPEDALPEAVVRRMSAELPGSRRVAELFPAAGRLALRDGGRAFWLAPAYLGEGCSEPAVCWNVTTPDADLVDCVPLRELGGVREMVRDEGPEPWLSVLVPDGAVDITVEARKSVQQRQGDNVLLVDFEPDDTPSVVQSDGLNPLPGCAPMFTNDAMAPEVREHFPVFEASGEGVKTEVWARALSGMDTGGIHDANARVLLREAGVRVSAVPAAKVNCDRPGVCAAAEFDDGRATEYGSRCWTLAEILDGRGVSFYGVDDQRVLVYALVPGGTREPSYEGRPMTVSRNIAYVVIEGRPGDKKIDLPDAIGG